MPELTDKIEAIVDRLEALSDAPNMNGLHKSASFEMGDHSYFNDKESYIVSNGLLMRIYDSIKDYIERFENDEKIGVNSNKAIYGHLNDVNEDGRIVINNVQDTSNQVVNTHRASNFITIATSSQSIDTGGYDLESFLNEHTLTLINPYNTTLEKKEEVIAFIDEVDAILDAVVFVGIAKKIKGLQRVSLIKKCDEPYVSGTYDNNSYKVDSEPANENSSIVSNTYGANNEQGYPSDQKSNSELTTFTLDTEISLTDSVAFVTNADLDETPSFPPFVPWYINNTNNGFTLSTTHRETTITTTPDEGDVEVTVEKDVERTLTGTGANCTGVSFLLNGVFSINDRELSAFPNGLKVKVWFILTEKEWRWYDENKVDNLQPNQTGEWWFIDSDTKTKTTYILADEYLIDRTKVCEEIDLHGTYTPNFTTITNTVSALQTSTYKDYTEDLTGQTRRTEETVKKGKIQATFDLGVSIESEYHEYMYFDNLEALNALYPNAILPSD